jgi:hypothetical protein
VHIPTQRHRHPSVGNRGFSPEYDSLEKLDLLLLTVARARKVYPDIYPTRKTQNNFSNHIVWRDRIVPARFLITNGRPKPQFGTAC